MPIAADGPLPEPNKRAEMISHSDNDNLKRLQDYVRGRMRALSRSQKVVPPEYLDWNKFLGEIRAERRKRLGL
jgi:hypothetical protein